MSICSRVRRREEGGAAAVEFALVGTARSRRWSWASIQYGWYFYVANNTSAAAREAARHVVVGDCWGGDFLTFVENNAVGIRHHPGAVHPPIPPPSDIGDNITVTVVADANIIGLPAHAHDGPTLG